MPWGHPGDTLGAHWERGWSGIEEGSIAGEREPSSGSYLYLPALKQWRRRRGLQQVDLARESGVPQYNISKIESGERRCTSAVAQRLAEALYVDLEQLLEEASDEPEHQGRQESQEQASTPVSTPSSTPGITHWLLQRTYLILLLRKVAGSSYITMKEREFRRHCKGLSWEELLRVVSARGREVELIREVIEEADPLPPQMRAFLELVLGPYPEQDIQILAAARRKEASEKGRKELTSAMRELL